MAKQINTDILWSDRKRGIFGLPWTFTKYELTEEKLLIKKGLLRQTEEEIRLYRIMDLSLRRSLFERIEGIGTIHCCSADRSSPEFQIKRVRNPRHVKDLISDLVEKQRIARGVSVRETMIRNPNDPDHDGYNN